MSIELLRQLAREGSIRAIDYQLARQVALHAQYEREQIALATALASIALGAGETCVDLRAPRSLRALLPAALRVDPGRMRDALLREGGVCAPGETSEPRPLILDAGRLYLQRYFAAECRVASRLRALATRRYTLSDEVLRMLDALFGEHAPGVQGQKLACAMALTRGLGVISGGPGTGKTTTVARLLLLVARASGARLRVYMAAPTGKAAARVGEALGREIRRLGEAGLLDAALAAQLPREAQTLHRLLGAGNDGRFRFDAANPLPADLVVLDESSMIDLRLLDALLEALPQGCRLLLLGDRDQLASVEAGNVFGALCNGAGALSEERARELGVMHAGESATAPGSNVIRDATAILRHSFRFDPAGGIARLAAAVNAGDGEAVNRLLSKSPGGLRSVCYGMQLDAAHLELAARRYRDLVRAAGEGNAATALARQLESFRMLCVLREGEFGVKGVNRAIEKRLAAEGLIDRSSEFYAGRPIMITRNDHGLRLYNGDIGILARDSDGHVRACFPQPGAEARWLPTTRLPEHETAFAMTVHKSQGSEFDRVLLLLPPRDREEMPGGREILYTAVTRARQSVELLLPQAEIDPGWLRTSARSSGLIERLHGGASLELVYAQE